MTSAPVRLSLVMKAMDTVSTHYRGVVRESKANRKKAKQERKRARRHKFRTDLIARGLMTIESKKKLEKEDEEENADSQSYDDWNDWYESVRIDGIAAEHLTLLKVSALFLGNSTMTASAS